MDNMFLLNKMQQLYVKSETSFKDADEINIWANQVEPLLEQIDFSCWTLFRAGRMQNNYNYSTHKYSPNINYMLSQYNIALEKLKLQVESENSIQNQKYFPPNSQLEIQDYISKILIQAQESLWIFDGYMDGKIVQELLNVNAHEIRFLTTYPKQDFNLRLSAAQKQFSKSKEIEVKLSKISHDRFCIIDKNQVWVLGPSYNHAGDKATNIHKVTLNSDVQKIISDFDSWWNSAEEYKP